MGKAALSTIIIYTTVYIYTIISAAASLDPLQKEKAGAEQLGNVGSSRWSLEIIYHHGHFVRYSIFDRSLLLSVFLH